MTTVPMRVSEGSRAIAGFRRHGATTGSMEECSVWRRVSVFCSAWLAVVTLTACFSTSGGESLEALRVDLPGTAAEGEVVRLRVEAVGSGGTVPFEGFSGTVSLRASAGTVTPASVDVTNGVGEFEVLFRGARAPVSLIATVGAAEGATEISIEALVALGGDEDEPATEVVPLVRFAPREGDYREDHPELPGVPLSFNTLVVAFEAGATVAEVNAALAVVEAEVVGTAPGVPGEVGSILYLRIPSSTHVQMEEALDSLRSTPVVLHAARDILLAVPDPEDEDPSASSIRPATVPGTGDGSAAGWSWDVVPTGANWGLERIRAPQLWNLNDAVAKTGATVATGVLDTGFADAHEDLSYTNLTPGNESDHGTHVAGIVGAAFDNGVGVDGVSPFAELFVGKYSALAGGTGGFSFTAVGERESWGSAMSDGLFGLIDAAPDVRVVNVSLAYNWGQVPVDTSDVLSLGALRARDIASEQGGVLATRLAQASWSRPLPLIVVAAGNDSNDVSDGAGGFVLQDARYASPFANAALEHGVSAILVVESVARTLGGATDTTRSWFSNVGGHVSAPGSAITSTWRSPPYQAKNGTSMAAPHVTGLVGYLYALDPTLTHAEIHELLANTAAPSADGASDHVDAFAAAMAIDALRGDGAVLRMLLDIDDGTADGNRRVEPESGADFTDEDADLDGGVGDGAIDMADFRRWRDGLLAIEASPDLDLDGSAAHPKKDVNGDGIVSLAEEENVYPRGDFNGDGLLSRTATRSVPGVLGGAEATDLEVLQARFDDPYYAADDLPALIDSADLTLDLSGCFAQSEVARVRSSVWEFLDESFVQERVHQPSETEFVHTAFADDVGYEVRVEGLDQAGEVISSETEVHPFVLGSDAYWRPTCGVIGIDVTFPEQIEPGETAPLLVRAGIRTSDAFEYQEDWNVDIGVQGGVAETSSGVTDADGSFETEVHVSDTAETVTVFVTVTDPVTTRSATETAQAEVASGEAPAVRIESRSQGLVMGMGFSVYEPTDDGGRQEVRAFRHVDSESTLEYEDFPDLETSYARSDSDTLRGVTAGAQASMSRTQTLDAQGDVFDGVTHQTTVSGGVDMSVPPDEDEAWVWTDALDDTCIVFEVVAEPASFELDATWTVSPAFSDYLAYVELDGSSDGFEFEVDMDSGTTVAESGTLPPDEYDLCFGFVLMAEILVNGSHEDFWPDAFDGSFDVSFRVTQ